VGGGGGGENKREWIGGGVMTSGIWEGKGLIIPLVISEGKGVVAGDGGVFNEETADDSVGWDIGGCEELFTGEEMV